MIQPLAPGCHWWALRVDGRGMMPQVGRSHADPDVDATLGRPLFPIERTLRQRGLTCYIPTEAWSRRRSHGSRQRITMHRALLAGFVLAQVPYRVDILDLVDVTPFVLGLYGLVQRLRAADVAGIERMERNAVEAPGDPYAVRSEDLVGIEAGPFAQFEGTVVEVNHDVPEAIAKVVVDLFGRGTEIVLPAADLRFIERGAS